MVTLPAIVFLQEGADPEKGSALCVVSHAVHLKTGRITIFNGETLGEIGAVKDPMLGEWVLPVNHG